MKKSTILLITGLCFIVTGAALSYGPLMDYWSGKQVATPLNVPFSSVVKAEAASGQQAAPTPAPAQVISGKPVRIQVPSLAINLRVAEGHFDAASQTWTLSKDKAHYGVNTPPANNAHGNTFIYGHNRTGVFRSLSRIKPGAIVIVTTENGHRFTYRFSAAYETNPNDDSLFRYQGPPIMTVQTCSGMWYQNRQLFTFTLQNVT